MTLIEFAPPPRNMLTGVMLSNNAGFRLTCRSPLCRYAAWHRLLFQSGNAALAFHRAAIAPELNRIQLSAICRGGQSGKVIDLLAWRCLPLGHPSAASDACAVELISSSKRQWNQHNHPCWTSQHCLDGVEEGGRCGLEKVSSYMHNIVRKTRSKIKAYCEENKNQN